MKPEIRILGIDDAAFDKNSDRKTLVIGTLFRGGEFMDGVLTCTVDVDGDDATEKIAAMVNRSKFKLQLRCIMLDGIAVGGFNVLDVKRLNSETGKPVIVVMRGYPDFSKIESALIKIGMREKIELLYNAGEIFAYNRIHFQICGIEKEKAEQILKISCAHSEIPEPIRIAHLIGAGITFGESKGRA